MGSLLLLLFSLLLHSASSDRLRFHLKNLVDRDVPACEDFFHHACSQSAEPKEFWANRVRSIFKDAIERLRPDAIKSSPIQYDLNLMEVREDNITDNNYAVYARERCKDNSTCYLEDQKYYGMYAALFGLEPTFSELDETDSVEEKNNKYVVDTTLIIDTLIADPKFVLHGLHTDAYKFDTALHTRIRMIEFMKSNTTYGDLHEVKDVAKRMKDLMTENIEGSKWLDDDDISKFIRQKIVEKISSIEVYHDFDEIDRNITTMQHLNREMNRLYFSNKRKTGAHGLDTILKLYEAFKEMESSSSREIKTFIARVLEEFDKNALYYFSWDTVNLLAPYIYRPIYNSEIIEEPIITYCTLGHELYHSLFKPTSRVLLDLYGHRSECIERHYGKACSEFEMGSCNSGKQTITEDGADLEGYRLAHKIFQENHSPEKLESKIDGLDTTLEQAFFYYAASEFCAKDEEQFDHTDVHSHNSIRVNALFSLMPEFTKAFACKPGEKMYVEEEDSCYVFGPNSK